MKKYNIQIVWYFYWAFPFNVRTGGLTNFSRGLKIKSFQGFSYKFKFFPRVKWRFGILTFWFLRHFNSLLLFPGEKFAKSQFFSFSEKVHLGLEEVKNIFSSLDFMYFAPPRFFIHIYLSAHLLTVNIIDFEK